MVPLSGIRCYCDTGTINSMYDSVVVLAHVGQAAMNRSTFDLNQEYTIQSARNFIFIHQRLILTKTKLTSGISVGALHHLLEA